MEVYKPTIEEIKAVVTQVFGAEWFDQRQFDLNFGAIRNDEEEKAEISGDDDQIITLHDNLFNDLIWLAWLDENNEMQLRTWKGTTDPGYYWRQNPGRGFEANGDPRGVGAIREGYYKSVYKLGHHGKREALVNKDVPFIVYRDNDLDKALTLDPSKVEKGWGFNFHYMGRNLTNVNRWSGGCNGTQDPEGVPFIVSMVKKQRDAGLGDRVSYSIARSSWFREGIEFAKEDYQYIQGLTTDSDSQ